jgi:flagellin
MPQFINTNVASLNTQRALNTSQSALQTSLQRLSSGLRINSAKDDAAGLAISERFTTQIRGLNQAVRNANDGISFSQTAEGALSSVGSALQRIRELAVQSANDTNSAADRSALNDEVDQLVAEIGRVANTTEFNGQKVLDGTLGDLFFQVGANSGQTIAVTGVDSRTTQLGDNEAVGNAGLTQDNINIDTITTIGNITIDIGGTVGLTAAISVDLSAETTLEGAVRAINAEIADRADDGDADADLIIAAQFSGALRIDNAGATTIAITSAFSETAFTAAGGTVTLGDTATTTIDVFSTTVVAVAIDLTAVSVSTRSDAGQAISAIDYALTQVNSLRSELGSIQGRFELTIANLQTTSENLSASRSRIRDTDFAAETSELTRNQILQQAGIAMLSQANAAPQNVLALLQ